MTPAQNPPPNGPAAAQGIPERDPFVETDLFPVLDQAVDGGEGPKGFAALAQPSEPPSSGSPPVQPPRPFEAPPTRQAPPPSRPASPPPGPPAQHTLWTAGPPSPAAPVPTAVPTLAPPPAPRSQGPLIALACVTGALLLTCGALIGVLWFSGDDAATTLAADATAGSRAAATTDVPTTSTNPRRVPTTTSASDGLVPASPPTADTQASSPVPTTASAPPTVTSAAAAGLVADFTWNPDPAVAGQSVTFADASSGGATRWVWTWNGNVVSSSQPKGFTTTLRQNTPVTLTVCRGSGDSACASVTKMVTVG